MERAAIVMESATPLGDPSDPRDPAGAGGAGAQVPLDAHVLIVDDDAVVRRLVRRALVDLGFIVETAGDVGPALELVRARPPDIAVVDLEMPTSGLELVHRLKADHGTSVHVVVLSGQHDPAGRVLAFDAGADDYLDKPIATSELQRRMVAAARTQRAFVEARRACDHADRLRAYSAEAAALLAHDLNNGLAIGLANLSYLNEVLSLEGDPHDALEGTLHSLYKMSALVANFVDIARFEDAALRPKVQDESIGELLAEVVGMHRLPAGRGAHMELDCDAGLSACIDRALVVRVFHNLVGNAMRYCAAGGEVRLRARRAPVSEEDVGVEIAVSNTGPQIADELAATLFSKYARGRGGRRGMGLYFCRLACEAHGGTIHLERGEVGPRFVVRLPGAKAVGLDSGDSSRGQQTS